MFDAVNFRKEVKENPFSEFLTETWSSGSATPEIHRVDPSRSYKVQELEKELRDVKPVREHYQNKGLSQEKSELLQLLETAVGKENRGAMLDQLRHFEVRAWANSVSKNEVAETYKEIGRILKAKGSEPLTPEVRQQVALDVIRNCADPTIISQGHHNTCNVTAVEVRTYSLYPAKAAKLIADVATTGEYSSKGGITVKLDPTSMRPDTEARRDKPAQGLRTYATQLFNLTAVNLWYSATMPGTRYEQREEMIKGKPDVVERLVDHSHGRAVEIKDWLSNEVIDSPHLGDNQIAFISDAIVGKHEPFAVLKVGPSMCFLPGEKTPPTKAKDIVDEKELPKILETLKKRHLLPAIAGVDTDVEPLNKDTGSGAYGPGGGHVVNLFDYNDGAHPKVAMDNQWSKRDDHLSSDKQVDAHQMFLCMAGKIAAQEDATLRAEQAKKRGLPAPKEELLALSLGDKVTADDVRKATEVIFRNQGTESRLAGDERTQWLDALRTLVNTAPVTRKIELLQNIQRDKICSDQEFGRLIAGAARSISFQKQQARDASNDTKRTLCVKMGMQLAEYLTTLPLPIKKSYFESMRAN